MSSSSDLISFIELLDTAANSQDQGQKREAQNLIQEQIYQNPFAFLDFCVQMIENEPYDMKNIINGGNFAVQCLTPKNTQILDYLRTQWKNPGNSSLMQRIVIAAQRMILTEGFTDIQSLGSKIFSLCFSLDYDTLIELIRQFTTYIRDKSVSYDAKWGIITVLSDIISLGTLSELIRNTSISEILLDFFQATSEIIGDTEGLTIPSHIMLKKHSCEVINSVLKITGSSLVPNEHIAYLLDSMSNSFIIDDTDLFSNLNDVMLQIVKSYYSTSNIFDFMALILNYSMMGLTMEDSSHKYNNISMILWRNIASFEYEILTKNQYVTQFHNITGIAIDNIYDIIEGFLIQIDPNDTNVEDPSTNQPSMIATVCLRQIFMAAPNEVFPMIKANFEQYAEVDDSNWVPKHAMLLLAYIASGKFNEYNSTYQFKREVYSFVQSSFNVVCQYIASSNQRIRETALYVTSQLICRYPHLLTDFNDPLESIESIFSYIGSADSALNETTHPTIILRIIILIANMCMIFRRTLYGSPLSVEGGYFETIQSYIMTALALPQCASDKKIIQSAYKSLNSLYIGCPRDTKLLNSLLNVVIENIHAILNGADTPVGDTYTHLAGLCSNISSIVSRINSDDQEMFPIINEVLFSLLEIKDNDVVEEALTALNEVIIRTTADSDKIPDIDRLMGIIDLCLDSNNERVIKVAGNMISDLFVHLQIAMHDYFIPLIEKLGRLIAEPDFIPEGKPPLINAISGIMLGIGKTHTDEVKMFSEPFLNILKEFRDKQYDTNNNNELALGSETLEAVAHGFQVYAKLFYNFDNTCSERNFLMEVSKVSHAILNLCKVKSSCLIYALRMLEECASHCSRNNNIILNKSVNHRMIQLAMEHDDISSFAKTVRKIIGNI